MKSSVVLLDYKWYIGISALLAGCDSCDFTADCGYGISNCFTTNKHQQLVLLLVCACVFIVAVLGLGLCSKLMPFSLGWINY